MYFYCPECQQRFDKILILIDDDDVINNNYVGDDVIDGATSESVDGGAFVIHDPYTIRRRVQHIKSKKYLCIDADQSVDCRELLDNDQRFVLTVTTFPCSNNITVTTFQTPESGKFLCAVVDDRSTGELVVKEMEPVRDSNVLPTDEDKRFFFQTRTLRDKKINCFRSTCNYEFCLVYEDGRLVVRRISESDVETHYEAHFRFLSAK